eukprot:350300-Chlamydomonas_euryale.AAC.2
MACTVGHTTHHTPPSPPRASSWAAFSHQRSHQSIKAKTLCPSKHQSKDPRSIKVSEQRPLFHQSIKSKTLVPSKHQGQDPRSIKASKQRPSFHQSIKAKTLVPSKHQSKDPRSINAQRPRPLHNALTQLSMSNVSPMIRLTSLLSSLLSPSLHHPGK